MRWVDVRSTLPWAPRLSTTNRGLTSADAPASIATDTSTSTGPSSKRRASSAPAAIAYSSSSRSARMTSASSNIRPLAPLPELMMPQCRSGRQTAS